MPTLQDIKNNAVDPKGFTPTITENVGFVPTIEQSPNEESAAHSKHGSIMSMTTGSPRKSPMKLSAPQQPKDREKADFTNLPETNYDGAGVIDKVSFTKEILSGEDSDFAKYVKSQQEEMLAYNEELANRAELTGEKIMIMTKNGPVEDPTILNLGKENVKSYKAIDILSGTKEEETPMADIDILNGSSTPTAPVSTQQVEPAILPSDPSNNSTSNDFGKNDISENDTVPEEETDTPVVINAGDGIDIGVNYINPIDTSVADEDEDDLEVKDSTINEESSEQSLEVLKSLVTEKLKPVSKRLDISGYTIVKKAVPNSAILSVRDVPVAKWPLMVTGVTVSIREIKGNNLEKIRSSLRNNDVRTALQIIYDHIVSAKPASFEAWAKTIAFNDYDNLFMAIYIAAFSGSNYIPVDCSNDACKKTYLTDDVPAMEMVKFKNAAAKEKFLKLYKAETTESNGLYATEVIPISEKYAVGFITPSLYSVMIETSNLDEAFINSHSSTVADLPYIDQIYMIDPSTKSMSPIDWKVYVNDMAKTIKSRVSRYDKVLDTLNADEIATIQAYVQALNDSADEISYQIPETTCPHCGHVNPAVESTAASMVFVRNQLGLLVNT